MQIRPSPVRNLPMPQLLYAAAFALEDREWFADVSCGDEPWSLAPNWRQRFVAGAFWRGGWWIPRGLDGGREEEDLIMLEGSVPTRGEVWQ